MGKPRLKVQSEAVTGMTTAGLGMWKSAKTRAVMLIPRMWQGTYRVGPRRNHILLRSKRLNMIYMRFCMHVG